MKHGGNGGYSLRNIAAMKRILAEQPSFQAVLEWHKERGHTHEIHEDSYFVQGCNPDGLPLNHEAAEFSLERIWHPNPTGCHQPYTPAGMVPLVRYYLYFTMNFGNLCFRVACGGSMTHYFVHFV